jgi:5-methylcytosine-specific restriction endonuclease McrA
VRWGDYGTPVLLFPTAAGDARSAERFLMLRVLSELLEKRRIKVYAVDSVAGQAGSTARSRASAPQRCRTSSNEFVYKELVPAIRTDARTPGRDRRRRRLDRRVQTRCRDLRHPGRVLEGDLHERHLRHRALFTEGQVSRALWHASPLHFLPPNAAGRVTSSS